MRGFCAHLQILPQSGPESLNIAEEGRVVVGLLQGVEGVEGGRAGGGERAEGAGLVDREGAGTDGFDLQ